MQSAIKIFVSGANGRMGRHTVDAINAAPDLILAGTATRGDDLSQALIESGAQVAVDFTTPDSVMANALCYINAGVHPIIGTTGLTDAELHTLERCCAEAQLGGLYAANFSLSAVLMMQFSETAARVFSHAEIIEAHHPLKRDKPSGTALSTAKHIAEAQNCQTKDIPIHSQRLPHVFAEQSVIFSGIGESLCIQQRATDRSCMMPGVLLACRQIHQHDTLVFGLAKLLNLSEQCVPM